MKIYCFDIQPWDEKYINAHFKNLDYKMVAEPLTLENVKQYKDAEIISIFLNTHVGQEIIDNLPKLKFIATRTTGYDNIDLTAAHARNILVSNVPFYGENTVAEFAFGLILALSRKIIKAYERARSFNFSCTNLMGFDLKGKTIGVVGIGSIGRHVVKIANGFEMNIIGYDPKKDVELAKSLNFKYTDTLEDLLKHSDIITLHAPYNKHTHHMVNKDNIKLIKPGALFINTARGALVDTQSLIWALDQNIISAAGLDVLEGEEEIQREKTLLAYQCEYQELKLLAINHLLLEYENVIVTPHNAYNTQEAINRILKTTEDNIRGFISNKIINLV